MAMLERLGGCIGIPTLRWGGPHSGKLVLVIDDLGPTLEESDHLPDKGHLARQLISRVELLHKRSVIHGNLKPSSFSLGKLEWQKMQVFLTDYEFCEGTARDDLRRVGIILAYILSHGSSWLDFLSRGHEAQFENAPLEVRKYMRVVESSSTPDYAALRDLFDPPHLRQHSTCLLYDKLSTCLREVGANCQYPAPGFRKSIAIPLLRGLSDVLTLYMELIVADNSPDQLLRPHDLPCRFTRDMRWFLKVGEVGPIAIYQEILNRIFAFMMTLVEVVPAKRLYWVQIILDLGQRKQKMLANSQQMLESKGWQHTMMYWQEEWNRLVAALGPLRYHHNLTDQWADKLNLI
jgi:serine/threonine protein kinase